MSGFRIYLKRSPVPGDCQKRSRPTFCGIPLLRSLRTSGIRSSVSLHLSVIGAVQSRPDTFTMQTPYFCRRLTESRVASLT